MAAGAFLMVHRGWGMGHARWLGVKVGLVAFLFLPLQAMHAYVCHVWVSRGLGQTRAAPYAKDLVRGLGMEEMIRTLEAVLFGVAVPLVIWLSLRRPS